jgi:hypothetical protein
MKNVAVFSATIVALALFEKIAHADSSPPAVQQPSSNILTLTAANAKINGNNLQLEGDADPASEIGSIRPTIPAG